MDRLFTLILALFLTIPVAAQAANHHGADKPTVINVHGLNKSQVEARFGAPKQRLGPVPQQGTDRKPPISTWVFDEFSIYFERDIALHRVEHRKTAQ